MDEAAAAVQALEEELIALRRDFHRHPELGFQEYRTAGKIEEYLRSLGLEPRRMAGTGVAALLEGTAPGGTRGRRQVLMLRADMDALPIEEENTCDYRSVNPGVMHACGHDAHMAMLLAAARVLTGMRSRLAGSIKFVFQPNEEIAGAEAMVEAGVLEDPKVDAALGIHIWTPLPSGTIGIKAGAVTSAMEVFKVTVHGRGGHTGYPESAVDPVLAAAAVVQGVQQVQTRRISLMKPTAIMFGRIAGGTKSNIIPDEVVLEGTIRYLFQPEEDGTDHPLRWFRETVESVCAAYGCGCTIDAYHENDAVVNDSAMVLLARKAAGQVFGAERVTEHATMACEDFSAFADRVPAVFSFIGTANAAVGSTAAHHNPKFSIDEATLAPGAEFLVRSVLAFFDGC